MRLFPIAVVLILAGLARHAPALAQQPQKGWIGVTVETVTPALMAEKKLTVPYGVLVTGIALESLAANDLKTGDVILLLNGQPTLTAEAFGTGIEALVPGSKAQLSVSRGLQILRLDIIIESPPPPVVVAGAFDARLRAQHAARDQRRSVREWQ